MVEDTIREVATLIRATRESAYEEGRLSGYFFGITNLSGGIYAVCRVSGELVEPVVEGFAKKDGAIRVASILNLVLVEMASVAKETKEDPLSRQREKEQSKASETMAKCSSFRAAYMAGDRTWVLIS